MSSATPHAAGDRVVYLDVLRGFALIGVCSANLFVFSGYFLLDDAAHALLAAPLIDTLAARFEAIFIESKFMGLFSFLFGASFWFFLDRATRRGAAGKALFYRRLGWLFAFGAVHGWLLWCFDILRFYALWGLLLPLCLAAPRRWVLALAACSAIVLPALIDGALAIQLLPDQANPPDALALRTFASGSYLEVLRMNWRYDWFLTLSWSQAAYQLDLFGRMLLGLYAARSLMLTEPGRYVTLFKCILAIGAIVGLSCSLVWAYDLIDTDDAGFVIAFAARAVEECGYLGLTLAYAAGLALLFRNPRWAERLSFLAPVGRMALSLYLAQTLIALWLFYGYMPGPHWMGRISPSRLLLICAISFSIQAWVASLWLGRFRFGPMEWLWRSLTYGQRQAFRRA